MRRKHQDRYFNHETKILKTSLKSKNTILAISVLAVHSILHRLQLLEWSITEVEDIDWQTIKHCINMIWYTNAVMWIDSTCPDPTGEEVFSTSLTSTKTKSQSRAKNTETDRKANDANINLGITYRRQIHPL